MSVEKLEVEAIAKTAQDLFDFACRELTDAKRTGREQERRRFFELARAIEAAFPELSLVPSPAMPSNITSSNN